MRGRRLSLTERAEEKDRPRACRDRSNLSGTLFPSQGVAAKRSVSERLGIEDPMRSERRGLWATR
jgi:hypothetical protein